MFNLAGIHHPQSAWRPICYDAGFFPEDMKPSVRVTLLIYCQVHQPTAVSNIWAAARQLWGSVLRHGGASARGLRVSTILISGEGSSTTLGRIFVVGAAKVRPLTAHNATRRYRVSRENTSLSHHRSKHCKTLLSL